MLLGESFVNEAKGSAFLDFLRQIVKFENEMERMRKENEYDNFEKKYAAMAGEEHKEFRQYELQGMQLSAEEEAQFRENMQSA